MKTNMRRAAITEASLYIALEALRYARDRSDIVWLDRLIPLVRDVRTAYEQLRKENIDLEEEEHGRTK